ncbi:epoxide hydrolase N-terminal domain-containing protein [Paenibacillus sp. FSL L8-0158]|uniref:epoxide hydrolase N-terminal domain-containing protein n=1 Tax=Paenibacillus sp. FSL L8-0158 TaxID=2954752 RepID=UPI0031586007
MGKPGWDRGTDLTYLKSLVSYWREKYDWREHESQLNRFSQFRCNINGIDVYFVHECGKGHYLLLRSLALLTILVSTIIRFPRCGLN